MQKRIYLDHAATTPMDKRLLDVMLPLFGAQFGNSSSLHAYGAEAKFILNDCHERIAGYLGGTAEEVVFTSGGTESNNMALKGVALANRRRGNHLIVSAIEHDSILNSCKWLEDQGFYISYLPVDGNGFVDPDGLKKVINQSTLLVSVMHANNEIGTIQPVEEIGRICREMGVWFHCDACQSFGKIPLDVQTANIDLLTINGHKIHGPKGVGALYIRKGVVIEPLLHGGGQEHGMRSTTENLPGIAGFAKAAGLCLEEMELESNRLRKLRKKLSDFLFEHFGDCYINGDEERRLPGHLNFSFQGLEGETIRILLMLDEAGIAVSAGSACSSNSGSHHASHVLQAIGRNPFEARGGIRVSFGRFTTEEEIETFCQELKMAVPAMKRLFR
ncbi:MAG: cysteine desulfurase [Marinilabiliales bacterium]|nr:cysteine desulfurase [Marinilabiliales bacterium]